MSGMIFISYRRDDDPGFVQAVFQRLESAFSREQLFMDLEGIKAGADFRTVIEARVRQCDVLLAVVGPRWLRVQDEYGRRRLDNDSDYVRYEIVLALRENKCVIPVLVNNAEELLLEALPEDLRPLFYRQKITLRPERFVTDCQLLIEQIRLELENAHLRAVDLHATLPDPMKVMLGEIVKLRIIADSFGRLRRLIQFMGLGLVVVVTAGLLVTLFGYRGILGKIIGCLQAQ
jgi:TIR domain